MPQSAYTSSLEEKSRPILQGLADPTHCQGAENMPVSNDQHVSGNGRAGIGGVHCRLVPRLADLLDETIESICDLVGAPDRHQLILRRYMSTVGLCSCIVGPSIRTHSPSGQPSLQISHVPGMPSWARISRISGDVMPS